MSSDTAYTTPTNCSRSRKENPRIFCLYSPLTLIFLNSPRKLEIAMEDIPSRQIDFGLQLERRLYLYTWSAICIKSDAAFNRINEISIQAGKDSPERFGFYRIVVLVEESSRRMDSEEGKSMSAASFQFIA
jgi:hypothetical protein